MVGDAIAVSVHLLDPALGAIFGKIEVAAVQEAAKRFWGQSPQSVEAGAEAMMAHIPKIDVHYHPGGWAYPNTRSWESDLFQILDDLTILLSFARSCRIRRQFQGRPPEKETGGSWSYAGTTRRLRDLSTI